MLKSLYDWHDKSDNDGNKIWYVPRSWKMALEEIIKACNNLNTSQEKIAYIFNKVRYFLHNQLCFFLKFLRLGR